MKILALLLFASTLFAQATTHSVTLGWTDTLNSAGTTYNVYRATGLCSGTPVFSKIASAVVAKTYQDTTVQAGNYCYTVTASQAGLESPPSNSVLAPVPLFAPANVIVTSVQ